MFPWSWNARRANRMAGNEHNGCAYGFCSQTPQPDNTEFGGLQNERCVVLRRLFSGRIVEPLGNLACIAIRTSYTYDRHKRLFSMTMTLPVDAGPSSDCFDRAIRAGHRARVRRDRLNIACGMVRCNRNPCLILPEGPIG